ncbi:MAG TPA: hypothetical protein VEC92_01730, partial [Nitrososphaerales archaeon]|nr:hypothetical protein [Nitrososphaerales archaeon]
YLLTASYLILDGGTGYTQPTMTFTEEGTASSAPLVGQTLVWADANTGWSISGTLTSSVTGEEWLAQQPTSGNASASEIISIAYQHLMLAMITQTGLPAGLVWRIVLGGKTYNITKSTMVLLLPPGMYSWSIETPLIINSTTVFTPTNPSGVLDLTSGGATLEAQYSNLIVATVQVGPTTGTITSLEQGFNATVTKNSTAVALTISSSNSTGPRVLIFYIANGALGTEFPNALTVLLDGASVGKATSVLQLFDVSQTTPLYATTTTANGYEVIVYLPHLSTHTVVLQVPAPPPPPSPSSVPANLIPFVFLIVAILAALINIMLARRGKKGEEKKARPRAERKPQPWT